MKTKAFLPAIVFLLASLASCNSSVPKSLVTDERQCQDNRKPGRPALHLRPESGRRYD